MPDQDQLTHGQHHDSCGDFELLARRLTASELAPFELRLTAAEITQAVRTDTERTWYLPRWLGGPQGGHDVGQGQPPGAGPRARQVLTGLR